MTSHLPQLPARPVDGHKGTFGTVCVVGGRADDQHVMIGGPAFAALGALRSGCGLAVLAVPTPIMAAALVIAPSATGLALPVDENGLLKPSDVAQLLDRHLADYHCIAIGPGLGANVPQQQVVVRLIGQDQVPVVIDADALNALAALPDFHRDLRAQAVLTPHPGEFARLAKTLGIKTSDRTDRAKRPATAELRQAGAQQLAQRLGCVVALKGHHTVISDGQNTFINETGNVALATAGTGDVLSGMIAGFVAQFFKPLAMNLLDCTRLAVHVHGLAADRWAAKHGDAGMLATDLLEMIPEALAIMRGAEIA